VAGDVPLVLGLRILRRASQITRLLMAILIIGIFALAIALEATGHVVFRGRLPPVGG
jgi:hypothetical protein